VRRPLDPTWALSREGAAAHNSTDRLDEVRRLTDRDVDEELSHCRQNASNWPPSASSAASADELSRSRTGQDDVAAAETDADDADNDVVVESERNRAGAHLE